jgi:hypothetical protein
MADETIIDKAMALIPGVGGAKKKTSAAQRHKHLQAIQKKLAALASDVEKLAAHVAEEAKDVVTGKKAPAQKAAAKPAAKPKPAKATAAKTAAAKPAAAAKKPAASPKKKPAAATKAAKPA